MGVRHHGGRTTRRRWLAIVTPIALVAGGVLAGTPAAGLAATPTAAPASTSSQFAYPCGATFTPGRFHCLAIRNMAAHPTAKTVRPGAIPAGNGYGPSDLQAAYGLTAAADADGAGTTVAVVDAYDDPTAAADLVAYRSAAGLPALTAGQFTVYNQEGQTSPLPAEAPADDDWTVEESLDVDMVSAICPLCKIDLVEADNDLTSSGDLFIADVTAATTLGAKYITDSWGIPEASGENAVDPLVFSVPGVVYVAGAGDAGYAGGMIYPAASPDVVSVGGTTLDTASNARGWTESAWYTPATTTTPVVGTGSGCSAYEPQPSWQASLSIITSACSKRVDNDVAADADPNTGAAIYDTSNGNGGWEEFGGTSESSPIIAAVFALAGNSANGGSNGGNNAAESIYTNSADLNEVTASSNGTCTESVLCTATGAANTYNGPTGWGTPDGLTAFQSVANTVIVTSPGNQTGTVGTAASLQISASDSDSSQTLTYTASGLPAGLSISSAGLISGTPTTAGTSQVTVTATDGTNAAGTASFTWTISPAASGTGNTVTVTNPGSQAGTVGTAASLQISASDSDSSQTLTYTASGLPAGLSISSGGLISGTPTTAGTSQVTVTAVDTTGASGTASFTWTIAPSGGNTITVDNPGSQVGFVGIPASLQILATDSDSSQTLTYSAAGLPAGLSISSSTGLISGTPTTAGTSNSSITVTDTTGASATVFSTWYITAASTGCTAKQLLGNPGFETGSIKPWSSTSDVLAKSRRGLRPQAGKWLAWLDGYATAHKDTLAQKVTLPGSCKNAVLTFWVEVHSNVTGKAQQAKNTLVLDILNASGKVVKKVAVATAANHDTKYVKHTVNLSSYSGKTITIEFIGTEARGGNTSFLEDSNALNVS
jgi:hypothetical protein